jgi:WD40 repeat protein
MALALPLGFAPAQEKPAAAKVDRAGDALPAGTVSRLGTLRFRPTVWVDSLAVSSDGQTIVTAGSKEVALWELATGKKIARFESDCFRSPIAFGNENKTLVTIEKHLLRERELPSGKVLREASPVKDTNKWDVCSKIDGRFVAFHDYEAKAICVWDVAAFKESTRFNLDGDEDHGHLLALSADGKTLAIGGDKIEVWDVAAGKKMKTLSLGEGHASNLAISPDGSSIVCAEGPVNSGVRAWDWRAGAVRKSFGHSPYCSGTYALAFSPDGKRLATITTGTGDDGFGVRVWDFAADREILRWSGGGRDVISIRTMAFTPDGNTLVAAGTGSVIHVWNVSGQKERQSFDGATQYPHRMLASPDGRWLAVTTWHDDELLLWEVKTGVLVKHFGQLRAGHGCAAFTRDGKSIAYPHADGSVRLCESATGKEVRRFDREPNDKDYDERNDRYVNDVTALAFDDAGKVLFVSYADRALRLFNVADGKLEQVHALAPRRLERGLYPHHAFSPDARTFFDSSGEERTAYRAYDPIRGQRLDRSDLDAELIGAVLSPDGKSFAYVDNNGSIVVRDVVTGQEKLTLPRPNATREGLGFVRPLAYSADGRRLASRSVDQKTIELWDVDTGRRVRTIDDVQRGVSVLAFVRNDLLASGGFDTTILLWDVSEAK